MKRIAFLTIVFFFGINLCAQEINFEIKVNNQNEINIKVSKGTPPFSFFVMTNDPVNGDIIKESGLINKWEFTFKDVQPGMYFVKIIDNKGMIAGKTVNIEPENN
jgi:hypothetical protein